MSENIYLKVEYDDEDDEQDLDLKQKILVPYTDHFISIGKVFGFIGGKVT